jgi:hypothetical protein
MLIYTSKCYNFFCAGSFLFTLLPSNPPIIPPITPAVSIPDIVKPNVKKQAYPKTFFFFEKKIKFIEVMDIQKNNFLPANPINSPRYLWSGV